MRHRFFYLLLLPVFSLIFFACGCSGINKGQNKHNYSQAEQSPGERAVNTGAEETGAINSGSPISSKAADVGDDALLRDAEKFNRHRLMKKAEDNFRRVISITIKREGPTSPLLINFLEQIVEKIQLQREFLQAELIYLRASRLAEWNYGRDNPTLANLINRRMENYRRAPIFSSLAYELALRSYDMDLKTRPDDALALARDLHDLAHINIYKMQWKEAEKYSLESIRRLEKGIKSVKGKPEELDYLLAIYNASQFLFEARDGMGKYKEARDALYSIHDVCDERIRISQSMDRKISIFGMFIGALERADRRIKRQGLEENVLNENISKFGKEIETGDFTSANEKLLTVIDEYEKACIRRKLEILKPEITLEELEEEMERSVKTTGADSDDVARLLNLSSQKALEKLEIEKAGKYYSRLYKILDKKGRNLSPFKAQLREMIERIERERLSALSDKDLDAWYWKNKDALEVYQKVPALLALGDMEFCSKKPLKAAELYGKALTERLSGLVAPLDPSVYLLAGQTAHAYLAHDYNPGKVQDFVINQIDEENRKSSVYHALSRIFLEENESGLAEESAKKALELSGKDREKHPLDYARDLYWMGFLIAGRSPDEAGKYAKQAGEVFSSIPARQPEDLLDLTEKELRLRHAILCLRLAYKAGDREEIKRLGPVISDMLDRHVDEAHWAVFHLLGYGLPEAAELEAPGGDEVLAKQISSIHYLMGSAQNGPAKDAAKELIVLYEQRYKPGK